MAVPDTNDSRVTAHTLGTRGASFVVGNMQRTPSLHEGVASAGLEQRYAWKPIR